MQQCTSDAGYVRDKNQVEDSKDRVGMYWSTWVAKMDGSVRYELRSTSWAAVPPKVCSAARSMYSASLVKVESVQVLLGCDPKTNSDPISVEQKAGFFDLVSTGIKIVTFPILQGLQKKAIQDKHKQLPEHASKMEVGADNLVDAKHASTMEVG
jgi:hypothetical protein